MAHKDVAVLEEEEEDLGAVLKRLEIPYKQLEQNSFVSIDDCFEGIKEIIEDSNSLNFEDSREFDDPTHNVSIDDSHNVSFHDSTDLKTLRNSSSNSSKAWSLAAKQPRNKRGRRTRRCFKSAASLFGSEVDVTDKCCSHCGTRNTPLWREGPKGPGTLCNACGVRYRTGRLLPEYRPASSPDFKPNVHSNFHRKVMEIRKEKKPPNSRNFGFEGFQL